jgi:putative membrane protein
MPYSKTENISVFTNLQKIQEKRASLFKFIIFIFHLVGIIGMSIPNLRPFFQIMTPFHLLLSLGILLLFHSDWNKSFSFFAISAFLIGYGSEVLGVHTGFPFGNYHYGTVLGIQLFEVPLMIGVNWLLLVYLTGNLFSEKIKNNWLAAALGAGLMVGIDFLIEPVAIKLDFWSWERNEIPLSNYIGWLAIGYLIHLIFRKASFQKENPISSFLLINLIAFFIILNFIV